MVAIARVSECRFRETFAPQDTLDFMDPLDCVIVLAIASYFLAQK
jgi:hypothetical protein